ncbi:MAG: Rpn family recombination-promoting nuclease/putative transposase [Bacteroidales bacterium]|nr:Rpn family recombination-promoting nuclease/putative transposase [Bacteroidales bacterium]
MKNTYAAGTPGVTDAIGRYANVLLDDWFKRTFGDESRKRLLILFLREVIPDREIIDLTYAPQEHTSPIEGKRSVRVDVECTDQSGRRFVVEMQLSPQDWFYERALFNTTFAIQEQMNRGDDSYLFPEVYFIGVMKFAFHKDSGRVRYSYTIREESSGELMTDRVKYIFLELPNSVMLWERPEATVLDKFCYALFMLPELDRKPEGLEEEIFRILFESAEIATFTPQERIKYIHDMTTERDIRNQLAYARKEGREEGFGEGLEEGIVKGREEGIEVGMTEGYENAARKLAELGVDPKIIEKATGVKVEKGD